METVTCGAWKGFLGQGLAERELMCVLSVASGQTDKEIARFFGLTPRAIRGRIESAMFKLGTFRRPALIAEAMRRGLIAPAMAMFLAVITCSSMAATDPVLRVRRSGSHAVATARLMRRSEWVV